MPNSKYLKKSEEIQEVISRLFATKGYHATSMSDIAKELCMNKATLYYYVDSKEGILFKLINDALDASLVILGEICERNISPEDKLDKVLQFYIRHYGKRKESLKLLVNEVEALNNEKDRDILIDKQRRFVRLMESIFEQLIAEGKIVGIPPAIATFAFFGMAHYTIRWYNRDGSVSVDELAKMFLKIFMRGILER